jgi:GDP/UDP-N,N'-diacetylbacillosamine 2-epimerase (hydrolysing)
LRKICVFTSNRAEYGLLEGVVSKLAELKCLQLLVSGSHLSKQFGMTVSEIERDGHLIDKRVGILKFDDSPVGICKTMGVAMSEFGEALEELNPDLLLVLGDRYETFCVAAAAQILRIPVAHIHGGENTEGIIDEAFRHSITKMAHLHFPSCEDYRRRIIQLGENPKRVFNVGALGLENIRSISLMTQKELGESISFRLDRPFFLVTFHPVTLEKATAGIQFGELLSALEQFPGHKIIFTNANADPSGQIINEMIATYSASNKERCLAVASLGLQRYLSAMKLCDAVVGNSSSGIIEAPALKVPTVNIGDRQNGRIRTLSTLDCAPDSASIAEALRQALGKSFRESLHGMKHPCDKDGTAHNIVDTIANADLDDILKKTFYDFQGGCFV